MGEKGKEAPQQSMIAMSDYFGIRRIRIYAGRVSNASFHVVHDFALFGRNANPYGLARDNDIAHIAKLHR